MPAATYEPFRRRAEREHRSVEEAVLAAMEAALAEPADSDEERRAMLGALDGLDSAALRQLVARGAETEDVLVLAALNERRQRAGLTPVEERMVERLIRQHDRAVLLRAKALAVLHGRGEDIAALLGGA